MQEYDCDYALKVPIKYYHDSMGTTYGWNVQVVRCLCCGVKR